MSWRDNVSDSDMAFAKTLLDTIGTDGLKTMMRYHLEELDALEHTQLEITDVFKHGCDRCGVCCRVCEPQLTDDDIVRICKYLEIDFDVFYDKYMNKSHIENYLTLPCPFLHDNECKIYDVRPNVCRNYPFSGDTLTVSPCKLGKLLYDEMVKTYGTSQPSKDDVDLVNMRAGVRDCLIDRGRVRADLPRNDDCKYIFVSNEHLLGVLKRVRRDEHARNEIDKYLMQSK